MTKSRGRLPDVMTEEQLLAQLEQPVGEYYQDEYWFVCGFDDSYIDTSKKEYKEDTPPKTYREAYEEECRLLEEKKDKLRDIISNLNYQYDQVEELIKLIDENEKRLKWIISHHETQITSINITCNV